MVEQDENKATARRLELMLEVAGGDLWELDLVSRKVKLTTTHILTELGYQENNAIYLVNDFFRYIHSEDMAAFKTALRAYFNRLTPQFRCEFRLRANDGSWIWYATYGRIMDRTATSAGHWFLGAIFNIDNQRYKTREHEMLIRTLKLVSECSTMLVQAVDEQALLDGICRLAVQTGGYRMAWIGFVEHDAEKSVSMRSHSGVEEGYISSLKISWSDTLLGRGSIGKSIRTKATIVNHDYEHNPSMQPWREAALQRGYRSSITLPLVIHNDVIGILNIHSKDLFAFSQLEVVLLEELASTLSYGIETLRTRRKIEATQIALKKENEKNLTFLHNASDGIHILDEYGNVLEVSDSFCAMLGYQRDEMIGANVSNWEAQLFGDDLTKQIKWLFESPERTQFETLHRRKNNTIIPVEISTYLLEFDGKKTLFNSSRDISERKNIERSLNEKQQQLIEREEQYRNLVNNLHTAIVVHAPDTSIIFSNPRSWELLGLSEDELLGKVAIDPSWCFMDEQHNIISAADYPVNKVIADLKSITGLVLGIKSSTNQTETWVLVNAFPELSLDGNLKQVVVHFEDITERKQANEKIYHLAFFDDLTSLPNRRLLMDRLHIALDSSARNKKYGAVLFIDMDKFKTINDILGHDFGDLLLIEVANRILLTLRKTDTVARLGGDEFVVILQDVDTDIKLASQKIATISEKIRLALTTPYLLKGNEQHSSPSIGVAMFCDAQESPDSLLRQADMAMYKAKDAGRNAFRFFNPEMQLAVESRASIEADLRHAIPNQQLRLMYQIQVDSQLRPIGAEVLVRWLHPKRGLVSPMQFIPIAEESALILDIGSWVLTVACQQLAIWASSEKTRQLTLAVNVSAQQFRQPDFVEMLAAMLEQYQVQAARLKLELTESVVLNDVDDVVSKMHAIRNLGVHLSMDDFGTGYSSLSYLKQLPLNQIKIDQSFVRDIISDPNDAVMVKTIIDLANNFRLHVIAEGVEDQAQLDFLKLHGCMAFQGYLFSKPIPIDQFMQFLETSYFC